MENPIQYQNTDNPSQMGGLATTPSPPLSKQESHYGMLPGCTAMGGGGLMNFTPASECLSSMTSFSLLHKILLFSSRYFMQMSKLNSLLEATRGLDEKENIQLNCQMSPCGVDTSNLTIRCLLKLFLEGEARPRTEAFKSHINRN